MQDVLWVQCSNCQIASISFLIFNLFFLFLVSFSNVILRPNFFFFFKVLAFRLDSLCNFFQCVNWAVYSQIEMSYCIYTGAYLYEDKVKRSAEFMNENQIRTLVNHPFLVPANYMVNIWNLCRAGKRVD